MTTEPTILISWLLNARLGASLNAGAFYYLGTYPPQPAAEIVRSSRTPSRRTEEIDQPERHVHSNAQVE